METSQSAPETIPDYLSPEWHDYVMTQFIPEELVKDPNKDVHYPTTSGLRRVAEKLLGTIISSKPTQVFPVTDIENPRSTVVYEVVFDRDGREILYSDVADVWVGNTDPFFVSFAPATASTRAEGRALRKALKLRVCAAEELCKIDAGKEVVKNTDENISGEQITLIDRKCKKLDIEVVKFINAGEQKYRSIESVSRSAAAKMIQCLTEFTNDKSLIPAQIMGYNSDWKK